MAGTTPLFPAKGDHPNPPAHTSAGDTQPGTPVAPHSPSVAPTHIFEGEDNGGDNPGHHDHDAQHAEEPRTRRKINLPRGGHGTYVTGEPGLSPPPGSPRLTPPRAGHVPLLALVWKQKMVTMMATMAVMSMAIRTALVRYMLQMEGTPESPHTLASPCHGGVGDPPRPRSWAGTPLSPSPGEQGVPRLLAGREVWRLEKRKAPLLLRL